MRTHYCGELNQENSGQEISVCGWVNRRRDHGGVIFIDLRDKKGILQVVVDPDNEALFSTAESVRNEFVLKITGLVRARPEGTNNKDMSTGEIEVLALDLEILNSSETHHFSSTTMCTTTFGRNTATSTYAAPKCNIVCNCVLG